MQYRPKTAGTVNKLDININESNSNSNFSRLNSAGSIKRNIFYLRSRNVYQQNQMKLEFSPRLKKIKNLELQSASWIPKQTEISQQFYSSQILISTLESVVKPPINKINRNQDKLQTDLQKHRLFHEIYIEKLRNSKKNILKKPLQQNEINPQILQLFQLQGKSFKLKNVPKMQEFIPRNYKQKNVSKIQEFIPSNYKQNQKTILTNKNYGAKGVCSTEEDLYQLRRLESHKKKNTIVFKSLEKSKSGIELFQNPLIKQTFKNSKIIQFNEDLMKIISQI